MQSILGCRVGQLVLFVEELPACSFYDHLDGTSPRRTRVLNSTDHRLNLRRRTPSKEQAGKLAPRKYNDPHELPSFRRPEEAPAGHGPGPHGAGALATRRYADRRSGEGRARPHLARPSDGPVSRLHHAGDVPRSVGRFCTRCIAAADRSCRRSPTGRASTATSGESRPASASSARSSPPASRSRCSISATPTRPGCFVPTGPASRGDPWLQAGQPIVHRGKTLGVSAVFARQPIGDACMGCWLHTASPITPRPPSSYSLRWPSLRSRALRKRLELENEYLREEVIKRLRRDGRPEPSLEAVARADRPRRSRPIRPSSGPRRERHRQGAGRSGDSPTQASCEAAAHQGELVPRVPSELHESEFFGHARGLVHGAPARSRRPIRAS